MSGPRPWGWHRLDPATAGRLVADADLPARSLVLDVGAGDGVITGELVRRGHRVVAIELHPGRAAELRRRFADADVIVVRVDAADLRLPTRPFHVVANPPFAVGSALLRRLLHPGGSLRSARVVLQAQAVGRWSGPRAPGRSRWARSFVVADDGAVPRRAFTPRPHVDARILTVRRIDGGRRRASRRR